MANVRKWIWAAAAFAMLFCALGPARAAETVELRGYGKVSADLTKNRAVFVCENAEKADILLGKLLADLFWDGTLGHVQKTIAIKGTSLDLHSLPGQGAAVIARAGATVVVIGGSDERETETLAANEPLLAGPGATSRPKKPYPKFLDFFDNRALKGFVHPMHSVHNEGFDAHWAFLNIFGGGEAMLDPVPVFQSPAPGVFQWSATDYEVSEAERRGGMIAPGAFGGGGAPLWEHNAYPEHMMRASDTTLLSQWGNGSLSESGAQQESWAMPLEQRLKLDLGFLRKTVERYRNSPAVGGWYVFSGAPGPEFGFHDRASQSWDVSMDGAASWRHWLRDVQHYSLEDLGERWFGDRKRFSNWSDVVVPDANEFITGASTDSLRIDKGWRWRPAQAQETAPPALGTMDWTPIQLPPSQEQDLLPASDAGFFAASFDSGAFAAKPPQRDAWLVFTGIGAGASSARIFLNGVELKTPQDPESKEGPFFAVLATGALKQGANDLVVWLKKSRETSAGRLAGPVLITAREPKRMPYLGRGANARYSDFRHWQAFAMTEQHRETVRLVRQLDPDRPLILSGSARALFDYSTSLAADYGMAVEHTGREAWYHPWWPGLGLVAGFYGTSEESATAIGDKLDREFSWIMFDADSSHTFFWDVEDYIARERQDHWFSAHLRQLQLFGKYLRSRPKIVILRSSESGLLGKESPTDWDLGRGELQNAHFDNVYASEREVEAGLVNGFPVMIDSGSEYMEPEAIAAIRKYVEAGGTFVALHNTGLHTALAPDSNPIASLTGFKISASNKSGKLVFGRNLPIFKAWEGKEFQGGGSALDHKNDGIAKGSSLDPSSLDGDSVALAKWADGGVAVGYRRIGKGRVIVLGGDFWRRGRDLAGVWRTSSELEQAFLEQLLSDCGVRRNATAGSPDIWTRKMQTKNGLQDWSVAINSASSARAADVWMQVDDPPEKVVDLITNEAVDFVAKDGGIAIKNVNFGGYEVKAFAVKRKTMVEGLPIWWGEKTFYWRRGAEERAAAAASFPAPPLDNPHVIAFDVWKFQPDRDGALAAATTWRRPEFDDRSWKTMKIGPWNILDPTLRDYRGAGLYRRKFVLPPDWSNKQVLLSLYSFDTPIAYDFGRFFINGLPVADYSARGWSQTLNYDVTSKLHPGENVLAVEVHGGPQFSGLGGAIWLEAEPPLQSAVDLASGWRVVAKEGAPPVNISGPPRARGLYLVRDFDAPPNWRGQTVYLEISSSAQWLRSVLINGKPINYNGFMHPFGLWTRINLAPYLRPGSNRLKLVSSGENGAIQMTTARIGALGAAH